MKCYIQYMNKDKGFTVDKIEFKSYDAAVNWGKNNLDNFNLDMVKFIKN